LNFGKLRNVLGEGAGGISHLIPLLSGLSHKWVQSLLI